MTCSMTFKLLLTAMAAATMVLPSQTRGTATAGGIVVDAAGSGVAGAEVRASDEQSGALLTRRTAADGRFAFTAMPEGRFVLAAAADGFLDGSYGAMAPGEPGVPVRVGAGTSATDLRIVLERAAALAGRVTNPDGDPVPSAVHAMAVSWVGGTRSLRRSATARTDADGRYELSGLWPGPYVVLAQPFGDAATEPREARDEPEAAYVAAFHPGVGMLTQAASVMLAPADRASGIDIVVWRAPVAPVEVTLARSGPAPLAYLSLTLMPEEIGEVGLQVDSSATLRPLGFARVPGGRLVAIASALEASDTGALERLWALGSVSVDGRTAVKASLRLEPGAVMEGRLIVEDGAGPAGELPEVWLRPLDAGRPDGILPVGGVFTWQPSGGFSIAGIAPGRYLLQCGRELAPAGGWSISRVVVHGQDQADVPIVLGTGERLSGVDVVLSNRASELQGTLSDEDGPQSAVTLVAFSADSRDWQPWTRRLRLARPDTSGFYLMRGLPAGEYFLAAVAGPLPAEPTDPQWLSALAAGAVRVLVTGGGRTVQDLRVPR
jgi:hypothetical protein